MSRRTSSGRKRASLRSSVSLTFLGPCYVNLEGIEPKSDVSVGSSHKRCRAQTSSRRSSKPRLSCPISLTATSHGLSTNTLPRQTRTRRDCKTGLQDMRVQRIILLGLLPQARQPKLTARISLSRMATAGVRGLLPTCAGCR